jgi:polar amino acid transport system substrate-binding protein
MKEGKEQRHMPQAHHPGIILPGIILLFMRALMVIAGFCAVMASTTPAFAQGDSPIPGFLDPQRRVERREALRLTSLRFLTEDDYPPFHYQGADGQLAGFNIDLARLICTELGATCTIQMHRWDRLLPALTTGVGDIVIASHRIDANLRREFEVSLPVYRVPARFVGDKAKAGQAISPSALEGKRIAVVGGSAHEAYLNAFFRALTLSRYENAERALEAMRRGEADFAFVDGVSGAFWLNGSESLACCAFIGGSYTESRFFGEGAGLVMRKDRADLRNGVDEALIRLSRDGRLAKLYLKHFPVSFY